MLKKIRTGEVLVEVNTLQQSTSFMSRIRMADLDIRVTPNRILNRYQGGISEPGILTETEADLLEGLKDKAVTAVSRIIIKRVGYKPKRALNMAKSYTRIETIVNG